MTRHPCPSVRVRRLYWSDMLPHAWNSRDTAGANVASRSAMGDHGRAIGSASGLRAMPNTALRYPQPGAFLPAPPRLPYPSGPYPSQQGYSYPQTLSGHYGFGPTAPYGGGYESLPRGGYRPRAVRFQGDPRRYPYTDTPPRTIHADYGLPGLQPALYGADAHGGTYNTYGFATGMHAVPRPLQPGNDASLDMKYLRWQDDFQKYTRVVDRDTMQMRKVRLILHPYLRVRNDSGDPVPMTSEVGAGSEGFIRWDMRLRTTSASFSTGPRTRGWSRGRSAPATFPPTTDLTIVSRWFPWVIPVHDSRGITVGGLLDALSDALHQHVGRKELDAAGGEAAKRIGASYHANRKELRGVLMDGLLRLDVLGERCEFGGFAEDEQLVLDKVSVPNYTTAIVALVCHLRGAPAPGPPAIAQTATTVA